MEIDREGLERMGDGGVYPLADSIAKLARAVLYLLDKVEPPVAPKPADDLLARQIKSAETIRDSRGDCYHTHVVCANCPRCIRYTSVICPKGEDMESDEDNAAWMRSWLAAHKPADTPEGETAEWVWQHVIETLQKAWPGKELIWDYDPCELIYKLIGERDENRKPVNLDALDGKGLKDEIYGILEKFYADYRYYNENAIRDILRKVKEAINHG